jgi:cell volume regulation protein A
VVVVVFSVVVQGGLVPTVARVLGLSMRIIEPEPWALGVRLRDEPKGAYRLTVRSGAPADGRTIESLGELPGDAWVTLLVRNGQLLQVRGDTELRAGDDVTVLADTHHLDRLTATFEEPMPQRDGEDLE